MLIILISFTLLTAIVGSMVNSYSASAKEDTVSAASSATAACIQDKDVLSEISDLTAFCSIYSRDIDIGSQIHKIQIYTKSETGIILNTEIVITIEESMKPSEAKDVFSTIKGFIENKDEY